MSDLPSTADNGREELQKKLEQDILDMFKLEWQRNDINFALSGVDRGELTHEDIEEDISLAVSKYVVLDILPEVVDDAVAQQLTAQLERLKERSFEYEVTDLERMEYHQNTPLIAIPVSAIEAELAAIKTRGKDLR